MTCQTRVIHSEQVQYCNQSSSEPDTDWLRHGYGIDPEVDRLSPPSVPSSLPNGIKTDSRDYDQEMITEISQWQISLRKDCTQWLNERITGSVPVPNHWPWRLPDGIANDPNYHQTAHQTECQNTIPEIYPLTTENQMDILPKLPTEMARARLTKVKVKLSSEWLSGRSGSPRPYQMPNQEVPKSAYGMYKAAFQEERHASIMVSMATYCEA